MGQRAVRQPGFPWILVGFAPPKITICKLVGFGSAGSVRGVFIPDEHGAGAVVIFAGDAARVALDVHGETQTVDPTRFSLRLVVQCLSIVGSSGSYLYSGEITDRREACLPANRIQRAGNLSGSADQPIFSR